MCKTTVDSSKPPAAHKRSNRLEPFCWKVSLDTTCTQCRALMPTTLSDSRPESHLWPENFLLDLPTTATVVCGRLRE